MAVPVYLYTGPEFGERKEAVKSVKTALMKKSGTIDEYSFYTFETEISEVIMTLQSESLFTSASFVVLYGAETIKNKTDIDLLASWIVSVTPSEKHPVTRESAVLVLVSDEISVDSKVEKLVPRENRHIFWEMFENRKIEWLQNFFTRAGYRLHPDAADEILDLVENNTETLETECSKFFFCFPAGHEVSAEDVDQVLSHNREESAFTLFDAMSSPGESSEKRFENSVQILQRILVSKNGSSVMLIAGLTSCFRRLSVWHSIHANGKTPDDFTLKVSGFSSQKSRRQYLSAAGTWNYGQTAAVIALLASTDADIRSSGTLLAETQLHLMLYAIVIRKGSFCLSYDI